MFRDRADAGRQLATRLTRFAHQAGVVVLGLPRGGVPVAAAVADHLEAPLDVFVVRKLGVPGHEELAMGAIASGGARVLNEDIVAGLHVSATMVEAVTRQEEAELQRREQHYRGDRGPVDVRGRIVILVDDGLATGASMRAAVMALRAREPAYLVVAAPVGAPSTCAAFEAIADEVVCAVTPSRFVAVGLWYEEFDQTTDGEVRRLLDRAAARMRSAAQPAVTMIEREVEIVAETAHLTGTLTLPERARGVVAFAHGSGSSRFSPRNRAVAAALNGADFATLLLDLLTPDEERADAYTGHLRFDIRLLAQRLGSATRWLEREAVTARLPVGYFGASTGAAAALVAVAEHPEVTAVVSRGGRPDLAGPALALVRAPTLLIVGGADVPVIDLNRHARARMRPDVEARLQIVPGATHLFEEPGALETVAGLATDWFRLYTARAEAAA